MVEAAEHVDVATDAQVPTGWAVETINVDAMQREERVPQVAKMRLRDF